MSFSFRSSLHVRTAYPEFYEQMKREGFIDTYHQLFTYAVLVGLNALNEEKQVHFEQSKNGDLFMVQNITESNLEIVIGIAAFQLTDIQNGDELFKRILDIGDMGISILKTSYSIDKSLLLNDFIS